MKTTTRSASMEIQRQINFQIRMKDRALENYLAKLAEIDDKIETLQELKRLQDIRENGSEAWGDHTPQARGPFEIEINS